MSDQETISLTEAAALCGYSERTIYRLRAKGDFPAALAMPYAARLLFDRAEVAAFNAARKRGPGGRPRKQPLETRAAA